MNISVTIGLLLIGILIVGGYASAVGSESSIILERGICNGYCPVYSVTLFSNGTVLYKGEEFVKEMGIRHGSINESAYSTLLDRFRKEGFFQMNDSYTAYMITDLPSAFLTVQIGDQEKRVDHYHGDTTAPDILDTLEDAVDMSGGVTRWTKPYLPESTKSMQI